MPIHDWTRVPSGLFHHFHQQWTIDIAKALNLGILPKGVAALVEQRAGTKEPDVANEIYAARTNESPSNTISAARSPSSRLSRPGKTKSFNIFDAVANERGTQLV